MPITRQEVEQLAKLARLELTPGEVDQLTQQLPSIVEYVSRLQKIDVPEIPVPLDRDARLRADEVVAADNRADILLQAPDRSDDFWKVDAVFS